MVFGNDWFFLLRVLQRSSAGDLGPLAILSSHSFDATFGLSKKGVGWHMGACNMPGFCLSVFRCTRRTRHFTHHPMPVTGLSKPADRVLTVSVRAFERLGLFTTSALKIHHRSAVKSPPFQRLCCQNQSTRPTRCRRTFFWTSWNGPPGSSGPWSLRLRVLGKCMDGDVWDSLPPSLGRLRRLGRRVHRREKTRGTWTWWTSFKLRWDR